MGAHSSPRQSSSTSVTCQLSPGKKREKAETKRGRPRAPTKAGTPRQGPEAAGGGQSKNRFSIGPKPTCTCSCLYSQTFAKVVGGGGFTNKVESLCGDRCLPAVANRTVAGVLEFTHPSRKISKTNSCTELCGYGVKVRGYVSAPP